MLNEPSKRNIGILSGMHDRIAAKVSDFARKLGLPEPVHVGHGVFACVATITPDIALTIVTGYHIDNNRHKKHNAIASYALDIVNGDWALTHQGISFNEQLLLYDGQNRLHGCIEAERPFITLVFFNVPDRAMTDTDTGVKRSFLDAANIQGHHEDSQWSTIIRYVASGAVPPKLSNSAIFKLGKILDEPVRWVEQQFPSHISRITVGAILGAVGRSYYHVNRDRLAEFCSVLREGVCKTETDKAAQVLLRWLNSFSGYGTSANTERYRKAQAAIAAFDKGQAITRLYGFAEDKYPLPTAIRMAVSKILP